MYKNPRIYDRNTILDYYYVSRFSLYPDGRTLKGTPVYILTFSH